MRKDIFCIRDHGSMEHILTILGVAHVLRHDRELKWKVRTTFELDGGNGLMGPELDILAHRIDKMRMLGGARSLEGITIGVEVEESFSRATVMKKWAKYSILVDRIYFIFLNPPRKGTKVKIDNIDILRTKEKGFVKRIKDYGSQIL